MLDEPLSSSRALAHPHRTTDLWRLFVALNLLNRREHDSRHLPFGLPQDAGPEGVPSRRATRARAVVHVASVRSGAARCGAAAPVFLLDGTFRFILERGRRRRLAADPPRPRARRRPARRRAARARPTARPVPAGAPTTRPPAEAREGARAHPDTRVRTRRVNGSASYRANPKAS
jgi:hypothetical protein